MSDIIKQYTRKAWEEAPLPKPPLGGWGYGTGTVTVPYCTTAGDYATYTVTTTTGVKV